MLEVNSEWFEFKVVTRCTLLCVCVNNNRNGQVAISSKSCDLPVAGQLGMSMIGIPKKCPRKHFLRMKVKYEF